MSESFLLKEFTSQSKKRINELILNEKLCRELDKNDEEAEGLLRKLLNKTRKLEKDESNIVEESNEPEKPKPDKAQYPINVQKKFFAINLAVLGPKIPSIYGPRGQRKSESWSPVDPFTRESEAVPALEKPRHRSLTSN